MVVNMRQDDETMDFIFFVIWQNVIKSKDRVENEGRYFNSFNYMILTIFYILEKKSIFGGAFKLF